MPLPKPAFCTKPKILEEKTLTQTLDIRIIVLPKEHSHSPGAITHVSESQAALVFILNERRQVYE